MNEYEHHNTVIIGCSFDEPEANREFARAMNFTFSLISDTDRSIGVKYGAARSAEDEFAQRIAYLIGPDGRILQAHPKVNPRTYPADQLKALTV